MQSQICLHQSPPWGPVGGDDMRRVDSGCVGEGEDRGLAQEGMPSPDGNHRAPDQGTSVPLGTYEHFPCTLQ